MACASGDKHAACDVGLFPAFAVEPITYRLTGRSDRVNGSIFWHAFPSLDVVWYGCVVL